MTGTATAGVANFYFRNDLDINTFLVSGNWMRETVAGTVSSVDMLSYALPAEINAVIDPSFDELVQILTVWDSGNQNSYLRQGYSIAPSLLVDPAIPNVLGVVYPKRLRFRYN